MIDKEDVLRKWIDGCPNLVIAMLVDEINRLGDKNNQLEVVLDVGKALGKSLALRDRLQAEYSESKVRFLMIVRGLPGSGKTTRVEKAVKGATDAVVCSADHFFYDHQNDGAYRFDPSKLIDAHSACQVRALEAMAAGRSVVIVDNTHVRRVEFALYLSMAKTFGYEVQIVDLFDGGFTDQQLFERCKHGVPLEKISEMRAKWEK